MLSFNRPISSYYKVQTAIGAAVRNRPRLARLPTRGAYLNLGCGSNITPGFCNLDYQWRPGIDVCWDATKGLPFKDNWLGGVFTEHCIEHISFEDWLSLSRELFRAMMPGAIVRIVVPSAEIYLRNYVNGATLPYSEEEDLPIMSVNRIFYGHGHKFIYDFDAMNAVLQRAKFSNIRRCSFGNSADSRLLIDSKHRQIESLYVEATK